MKRAFLTLSLCALATLAQAEGDIIRTELSRADAPGSASHEVIVSKLKISPGGVVPRHTHLGDEYLTIIEGGQMQTGDGRVITFEPGQVVRFPAGVAHGGLTAVGESVMVAITTHIVQKGFAVNQPVN